jgi:hypothetical protein
MRTRMIALAVFALLGAAAFAPAPFVKSHSQGRRGDRDVLAALQGRWKIVEKQRMGPDGQLLNYGTSQGVLIEEDNWQNVSRAALNGRAAPRGKAKGGLSPLSYKIVLDTTRRPVEFRLRRSTRTGTDYMVGIIHPAGDTVKVLYCLGTAFRRGEGGSMPHDFTTIPEGWYLMTLKRD